MTLELKDVPPDNSVSLSAVTVHPRPLPHTFLQRDSSHIECNQVCIIIITFIAKQIPQFSEEYSHDAQLGSGEHQRWEKRSTNQTSLIFNCSLEPYFYHIFSVLKCTQIMRDLGYSFSTSLSLRVAKNVQTRQCGLDRCRERCTTAGCGQLKLCTVLAQPGPCWLAREALEMSRICSALSSAPQLWH